MKRLLDKEDEDRNIGQNGDSNIQLDCLDLIVRKQPGGHGHLAAVDSAEYGEGEEGDDDVDTNLGTKPELLVKIVSFRIVCDQEESNKNHRSRDSSHHGQEAGATPHQGAGGGGGDKPFYSKSAYKSCKDAQTSSSKNVGKWSEVFQGWGETFWSSSDHIAQGDKGEVNSLDDEEEDEDDEVEDLELSPV